MKKQFCSLLVFFVLSVSVAVSVVAEEWNLLDGKLWSNDPQAATLSKDPVEKRVDRETVKIVHTGSKDWAYSDGKRIDVKPGEMFEISAWVKSKGKGSATICATTRDAKNEVLQWSYASKEVREDTPWTQLKTRFMVPEGIASIEPRFIGYAPSTVWLDDFTTVRAGFRNIASTKDARPVQRENKFLKLDVLLAEGIFSVTDKRTNRTWSQQPAAKNFVVIPGPVDTTKTSFQLLNTETLVEYGVELTLDAEKPDCSSNSTEAAR